MPRRKLKLTKAQERLMKIFSEVEDEDIREIMAEVVSIEAKHRSSSAKNFPTRLVRDAVDSVARLQEMSKE